MIYKVEWSDEAKVTFSAILEYLQTHFTAVEENHFIEHTNKKIELIASDPRMYRKSAKGVNVHFTNILKRTMLVYRIRPRLKRVELIHFIDGRRNPKIFKH